MLQTGDILGGTYQLEKVIGKGGMGQVWLARHLLLEEPRAIKIMLDAFEDDADKRKRFIEGEARNALKLGTHPNIVRVYDLGLYQGAPYIVMEYIQTSPDAADFKGLLRSKGRVSLAQAGRYLGQIASALDTAHQQGLIHRDVKPGNVLVGENDQLKLTDFGLIKDLRQAVDMTATGLVMGTPLYMAPEQARGEAAPSSDIYSLAIILFEMLTGKLPFIGDITSLLVQHASSPPPILHILDPSFPPSVSQVLQRALAKNPTARYANGAELTAAYLLAIKGQTVEQPRPSGFATAKPDEATVAVASATPSSQPAPTYLTPSSNPISSNSRPPTNLPTISTLMIGRSQEVTGIVQMLGRPETRLVTLTGPGGVGKTRLSLQVATHVLSEFPAGVFFLPLAQVREAEQFVTNLAEVLAVRDNPGQSLLDIVKDYLQNRRVLLVLDNFEQLIKAAPTVADLLNSVPTLRVLASSRIALRIYGEQEYNVQPLALPNPLKLPSPEALAQNPAVALFVNRARLVKADFNLTPQNAATIAEICVRLDGLPLAIELAVPRLKLLSPQTLLERLSNRLNLLTGGSRDLTDRQRTLRGAIEWSYDLLDEPEKALFARLSVFSGGCSLEAAEAVANADGGLELDVMDGLASLVEKSLLQPVEDADTRFSMLETLREYALEKLATNPTELASLREAHANFYREVAGEAEKELGGPKEGEWLGKLELEHENMKESLGWWLAQGEAENALRLANSLGRFWAMYGYLTQGRRWLEKALTLTGPVTLAVKARALNLNGLLARDQGDYTTARQFIEESLKLRRELGDKRDISAALNNLGMLANDSGDSGAALAYYEESLALKQALGDKRGLATTMLNLGLLQRNRRNYAEAHQQLEESLKLFRQLGDKRNIAAALNNLGEINLLEGVYAPAIKLLEESITLLQEVGDKRSQAIARGILGQIRLVVGEYEAARLAGETSLELYQELEFRQGQADAMALLGLVALEQADFEQASSLLRESLQIWQEVEDKANILLCLFGVARLWLVQHKLEEAAKLCGTITTLSQIPAMTPLDPLNRASFEGLSLKIRSSLGEEAFQAAFAQGQSLDSGAAISLALLL